MTQEKKCAVSGALAGAANGLFGAGGGMILTPLLARWAKLEEREVFATSVAVILPLSAVSAAVYFIRIRPDFLTALPYLLGGLLGGIIGGKVFVKIPTELLRRALALFIIYGGIRNLL